jgi:hypothetical protein
MSPDTNAQQKRLLARQMIRESSVHSIKEEQVRNSVWLAYAPALTQQRCLWGIPSTYMHQLHMHQQSVAASGLLTHACTGDAVLAAEAAKAVAESKVATPLQSHP